MVAIDTICVAPFISQFIFQHASPSFDHSHSLISEKHAREELEIIGRREIAVASCREGTKWTPLVLL
jgi:hypothetical protein